MSKQAIQFIKDKGLYEEYLNTLSPRPKEYYRKAQWQKKVLETWDQYGMYYQLLRSFGYQHSHIRQLKTLKNGNTVKEGRRWTVALANGFDIRRIYTTNIDELCERRIVDQLFQDAPREET